MEHKSNSQIVVDAISWAFTAFRNNSVFYAKYILSALLVTAVYFSLAPVVSEIVFPVVSRLISKPLILDAIYEWMSMFCAQHWCIAISLIILMVILALLLCFVAFFAMFYVILCFVKAAFQVYHNVPLAQRTLWVDFRTTVKCFIASIIYVLIVSLGLILFIVPGLYFASRYCYVIECIVGDNASIVQAFRTSEMLTRGIRLHALFLYAIGSIFSLMFPTGLMFFISLFIFSPFISLARVFAYYQCKAALAKN